MRRALTLSSFCFLARAFESSGDGGEVRANAGKIDRPDFRMEEQMKIVYSVAVPVILLGMLVGVSNAQDSKSPDSKPPAKALTVPSSRNRTPRGVRSATTRERATSASSSSASLCASGSEMLSVVSARPIGGFPDTSEPDRSESSPREPDDPPGDRRLSAARLACDNRAVHRLRSLPRSG
jgi:hypothetical protein